MTYSKSILIFSTLLSVSCSIPTKENPELWESRERKISFQWYVPWTLLPTVDSKSKTMTGVVDNNDGKSYVIHITDDISQERLSDSNYLNGTKKIMLQADTKNRLIKEDSALFHGQIFLRQIYFMHTDNWGLLKQFSMVRRTGEVFYSVQIAFPTHESDSIDTTIPKQLVEFDKGVRIDGK